MTAKSTPKKHRHRGQKRKTALERGKALIAVAFVAIGALGFWAGTQSQKSSREPDHAHNEAAQAHAPHATYVLSNQAAAPTVTLRLNQDSKSGYNLFLDVTNFRFAPEHAGKAHADGEGHAHIYADGKKLARLYGPAFYLDTASWSPGQHEVRVILTTNDHKDFTRNGQPIEAVTHITIQ